MVKVLLSSKIFHDETAAREWLERRIWKDGRVCPHCGALDASTLLKGKSTRPGLYQCNACREPFTVTVGTLYERSKIPLHKWLAATQLHMSSKKGMSALQIGRMLGISPKSSWFLMHRIRESLRETDLAILGGEGKTVEKDETFVGGLEKNKHRKNRKHVGTGGAGKEAVFSLVERGARVRSRRVPSVSAKNPRPILFEQVHCDSMLMTDQTAPSKQLGCEWGNHQSVNHSIGEYVRGVAHTNTIEGYFSVLKRGIVGTYHHVSPQHLKRYFAGFDYRYNERSALEVDDRLRMEKSIPGIVGRRLTYRRTCREGEPVRA
ncbi:MAG: IS1595 family transposase [Rhizomicrobium sp.]